jgi:predicted RNA-binding Zn-ribbon protein involved in translation (DUF1610 family)
MADYYESCVSCGKAIPVVNKMRSKHECPKRHDAAQKSADTRAYDDVPTRRKQSLLTRLAAGFKMIADDEDEE